MIELARAMTPQGHAPGEHLVGGSISLAERRTQQMSSRRLYLLTKGNCQAACSTGHLLYDLGSGSSFGEQSVLFGKTLEKLKVVTQSYCDVYWIGHDKMLEILQIYPVLKACLKHIFSNRQNDFVLVSELETLHNEMAEYLQENQAQRVLSAKLRRLEVSDDVKNSHWWTLMETVSLKAQMAQAQQGLEDMQGQLVALQTKDRLLRRGLMRMMNARLVEGVNAWIWQAGLQAEEPQSISNRSTLKGDADDVTVGAAAESINAPNPLISMVHAEDIGTVTPDQQI